VGVAKASVVSKKPQANVAFARTRLENFISFSIPTPPAMGLAGCRPAWSWGHEPAEISRYPKDRLVSLT
jgi:hypothetical protein